MSPLTRRRLLTSAAGTAAFSAAVSLMPANLQRVLAQPPPRTGSLRDVEHVVVLMMENRSFDHYFGTLSGVRGFDDPTAVTLSTGKSVFHQPDPQNADGYVLPFHLDTAVNSVQKIPTTSHAWSVQHDSWNHGKMDSWMAAHRKADGEHYPYVMGYYERADIPFHFALAEAFTVCDNFHSSVMGPTWPNRMMWMTGTIDPDAAHGGPIIRNTPVSGGYGWTTYAERLEAAGVSWRVYAEEDDYGGCNVLKLFSRFQRSRPGEPLYDKGIAPVTATQFEDDARAGRLPAVSWLIMTSTASEHPDYRPADGAAYIASKIDAIAANPEVWAKTVFILNYDENDGLFDHVVPPTPPPGTPGEWVKGVPIGGGFRVPAIVISPWSVGGWAAGELFDHTSVLRFLEEFTGVREPNISGWRRKTFGNLLSAFGFDSPVRSAPELPHTAAVVAAADRTDTRPPPVIPPAPQTSPVQEPGSRPRRYPRR
ncbi:alkaline phosphatase family protein [Mycobacteroides abscessus]|uniref:alkaline phosphatase family protein n=1 Tax=Mycobacteroides abscessus TaxID=36809 RepID=UPI000C26845B|nr:alkaline phosphatase family protein [Mycobacteroides abscessus]MBE5460739.1 phospholipase C, phosphocholine-specific [Mycobacteroides abscessus]QOF41516.1 phospholipase C, phosphocholine-specific [Mycobacteroides abscessus]QOF46212.1 phospholipase C, phosphocholine-specific [Mycobacteroides abscessus]